MHENWEQVPNSINLIFNTKQTYLLYRDSEKYIMNQMTSCDNFMQVAIADAKISLKEGNCGFGAVVAKDGKIIAKSHDTERTDRDPTAHAQLDAIRQAASRLGRDFSDC